MRISIKRSWINGEICVPLAWKLLPIDTNKQNTQGAILQLPENVSKKLMAIPCVVGRMFSPLLKNTLPLLQYMGHWYSPRASCPLSSLERNAASRHHKGGTKVCCLEYVAELTTLQPAFLLPLASYYCKETAAIEDGVGWRHIALSLEYSGICCLVSGKLLKQLGGGEVNGYFVFEI